MSVDNHRVVWWKKWGLFPALNQILRKEGSGDIREVSWLYNFARDLTIMLWIQSVVCCTLLCDGTAILSKQEFWAYMNQVLNSHQTLSLHWGWDLGTRLWHWLSCTWQCISCTPINPCTCTIMLYVCVWCVCVCVCVGIIVAYQLKFL